MTTVFYDCILVVLLFLQNSKVKTNDCKQLDTLKKWGNSKFFQYSRKKLVITSHYIPEKFTVSR